MIKRKIAAVITAVSLVAPVTVAPASAGLIGAVTGFFRVVGEATVATGRFLFGENAVSDGIEKGLCVDDHIRLKERLEKVASHGVLSLNTTDNLKVTTRAGGFYPLAVPWVLTGSAINVQRAIQELNKHCNRVKIEMAPISELIQYSSLSVKGHPWVSIGLNQSLVVTVPEGTDPGTYKIPVELTETTSYTRDGAPGVFHHKLTLEVTVEPGEPEFKNKARLTGSSDFMNLFSMFSS